MQDTLEYIEAKTLIEEKATVQSRLRDIDKRLRQLEALRPGIVSVVRAVLENKNFSVVRNDLQTAAFLLCSRKSDKTAKL